MRFNFVEWRKDRKKKSQSIKFEDYVTEVFTGLDKRPVENEIDLTEGYNLLTKVERQNMEMEKNYPDKINRREVLRNYTNPREPKTRSITPTNSEEPISTPSNVGQTVVIKRSASKLDKKLPEVVPLAEKKPWEVTPEDFGLDWDEMTRLYGNKKTEPTTTTVISPATEKLVNDLITGEDKLTVLNYFGNYFFRHTIQFQTFFTTS